MNNYLFAASVLLTLLSAGVGLTRGAAATLQLVNVRSPLAALLLGAGALLVLLATLSATVPPRG